MKNLNKFEIVEKYLNSGFLIELPVRSTKESAGYDIRVLEGGKIEPGETVIFNTGLKVRINEGQFLSIHVRSSVGIKRNLMLSNVTGVIDSDYYNNEENEGHIIVALTNYGDRTQWIQENERVAQGIFQSYSVTSDDNPKSFRKGGVGSTNKS